MVKNALVASISEFKNKFSKDNRQINLMQLNLFTYLLEGYYMNECNENSLFDSEFYEVDNMPFNIYNEAYLNNVTDYSDALSPSLKIYINDVYNCFKDLSPAEFAAITDDCHNNNHFRIYNQKKTEPLDKKYAKSWFRNSFLEFENNHYIISAMKVKNKTNIVTYEYEYEQSEVYCDLFSYNNNEDLIITYAKEFLELGKRDGHNIDSIRLNALMYLLEGYYTSTEKKPFLFKHDFEVNEDGPMMPALVVLYNYIVSQLSDGSDEEYKNYNYDEHLPTFYIKKIYDLYGKVSTAELNGLFMKYHSPYNIIASYDNSAHINIPKRMTADWITENKEIFEKETSEMKTNINPMKKTKDSKKLNIKPTCIYHKYIYRKNASMENVREFVNGRSILVNGTKHIANRFHNDKKSLELSQLNMIMYLSEGFYMSMEDKSGLYGKNFRVIDSIPNNDLIRYVVADSLDNNNIKLKKLYSISLADDKREYFDYMYTVLNDISVKDLKTLCRMKNSPVSIVDKYKQNEYDVLPKSLTSGWLTEEFLKDGKGKITTCDLKVKIKDKNKAA